MLDRYVSGVATKRKALARRSQGRRIGNDPKLRPILAGDTVVNHDGEGMRGSAGTGGGVDIDREGARPVMQSVEGQLQARDKGTPSRQSPATKNCQVPSGPIP